MRIDFFVIVLHYACLFDHERQYNYYLLLSSPTAPEAAASSAVFLAAELLLLPRKQQGEIRETVSRTGLVLHLRLASSFDVLLLVK